MIDLLLVGCLVVGLAFVAIAVASQRTPRRVASVGPPTSNLRVSELWAGVPEKGLGHVSERLVPTVVPVPRGPAEILPKAAPVALEIGVIGVHSRLHDLGLDSTGAIQAPSGTRYDEAAWYRHSPMPGSLGPSIILGHVDSASNGPSVFFRLGELVRGDRISITRTDGSIARFTVQTVARYSKDDFPTERVYGDLDHAGLRLITCGGAFNDATGHYEDNVVVFARLDAPGVQLPNDWSARRIRAVLEGGRTSGVWSHLLIRVNSTDADAITEARTPLDNGKSAAQGDAKPQDPLGRLG